ncbi:MAG: hypothetical protein ACLUUG_12875 [Lachnospiraceae bacterium]
MTHEQIAKINGKRTRSGYPNVKIFFTAEGYVTLSRGTVTLTDKAGLKICCNLL